MEGGGGTDRNPSMRKNTVVRRLTWVQGRKKDVDGYNVVETCSRACQYRPRPPLTVIIGPKEGLLHRGPRTPPHDTGRIRRGPLHVWTLGDLLGPPESVAKTE